MEPYDLHPLEIADSDDLEVQPISYWESPEGTPYLARSTSNSLSQGYFNGHDAVARRVMLQVLGIDPDTVENPQLYLMNLGWARIDDGMLTKSF